MFFKGVFNVRFTKVLPDGLSKQEIAKIDNIAEQHKFSMSPSILVFDFI